MALNCYKNTRHSVWHVYDDKTDSMDTIPFGSIVAGYVAHVLNMGDNGDINFISDEIKDKLFEAESLNKVPLKIGLEGYQIKDICTDTASYKAQTQRLMNALLSASKKNKPDTELYQVAEKFKWFGFNVVRNLPYDLSHDRGKKVTHLDIECFSSYCDEDANTIIQYIGVRYLNGSRCELFRVDDYSVAFGLDLHAYLFENTNTSHSIKFCSYCNRFFFAGKGNIKMCSSCRSKKEIDRAIRNERARSDPLQKEVQKTRRYLFAIKEGGGFDDKYYDFDKQLSHYLSKLNKKEIFFNGSTEQYDKELPIVSSEEDIIQWCINFRKRVKEEVREWRRS